MHSFSSLYNENTVISKEYTGPLGFDTTGVDCIYIKRVRDLLLRFEIPVYDTEAMQV